MNPNEKKKKKDSESMVIRFMTCMCVCILFIIEKSSCSHQQLCKSGMFRGRKIDGVVAADVNRMSWLLDSGLSSFVTTTTDALVYA